MPCTMCIDKGLPCHARDKVWGEARQARENAKNSFDGRYNDHHIEEIPRAPTVPDTEYINPTDGALVRRTLQNWLNGSKWDVFNRTLATCLIRRFGPNLSSKAVRHALLSKVLLDDAHIPHFPVPESVLEHSVVSSRYTRQAINDAAYFDILYACYFMTASSFRPAVFPHPLDNTASNILNHATAYLICLQNISVDVEELWLMTRMLYCILIMFFGSLEATSFRIQPQVDKIFHKVSQLTRYWVNSTPSTRKCPVRVPEQEELEFENILIREIPLYLDYWYHLSLVVDGDTDEIKQVGSVIRDKLLFDLSHSVQRLQRRANRQDPFLLRRDSCVLEYAVLVEPSIRLSQTVAIRDRTLEAALRLRQESDVFDSRFRELDRHLWPLFLAALFLERLPKHEGVPSSSRLKL